MTFPTFTQYCPVCSNTAVSTKSYDKALDILKKHVEDQHPIYDPNWYESFPEPYGN